MTAFPKTWVGTTGDYELASNWAPISVRNGNYSWTASGSGTNEYYLRTSGDADPGFAAAPGQVLINGSVATEGTVGSLTAGQWDYGDNDTLGYSTIYVRLADGSDPDSADLDHVQFKQRPYATDNVTIPAGAGAISSNLDQSAVAIGSFVVQDGYAETIKGSAGEYLRIDPDRFEFSGSGECRIDLRAAAIGPQVFKTAVPSAGSFGLYLLGSAMTTLNVVGGSVGVAVQNGETAAVTTVRVTGTGARLTLGAGVTATTVYQSAGSVTQRCASTTTTVEGGAFRSEQSGTIGTLNVDADNRQRAATLVLNSSGTITTLNAKNALAVIDFLQSGVARTATTVNHEAGEIKFDPVTTTFTTYNKPTNGPVRLTAQAA